MPCTNAGRLGLAANAVAVICIAVAFIKRDAGSVEGAYFNRSGAGSDTFVISTANIAPWLVAAAVLIVTGTAALLAESRRFRSEHSAAA